MKTTARACLIKKNTQERIRKVALVQEKLARSRLLLQLESCHRSLLDKVNQLLDPIIAQGHHGVTKVNITADSTTITPDLQNVWFLMSYHRMPLAWWCIDRCTLDQLASSYYGSYASPLQSPLRPPSLSEYRLVKRLLLSTLEVFPMAELDEDSIDLELVLNQTPAEVPVCWEFCFPRGHFGSSMQLSMTDYALSLMAEQPSEYRASANLSAQLAKQLVKTPIKANLEIGRQQVPVTSLHGLKAGDILPINLHPKCPVKIGSKTLFYATVHHDDGQMVAKITQEATHTEEANNG